MEVESIEYEEDLHQDADAVDVRKITINDDKARPVFTAGCAVTLNCVVYLKKAVGNPQIHFEVKGKVRVQYEGRMLDDSSHSTSGLRKSKRRKVREKMIFILPVVLSPG
jgi:copper homeostasis protein CutC